MTGSRNKSIYFSGACRDIQVSKRCRRTLASGSKEVLGVLIQFPAVQYSEEFIQDFKTLVPTECCVKDQRDVASRL